MVAFRKLLSLAATTLCLGCGSGVSYVPVEGIVRLDGTPLAGVEVRFAPDVEPESPRLPFSQALTDANGRYELLADTNVKGAVVGKHKVVVRRPSARPGPDDPPPSPSAKLVIPNRYRSLTETPFHIDVKADQKTYDLTLTAKES